MPQTLPLSANPAPADDYDVDAWLTFYEQNPGMRRSAGADAPAEGADTSGDGGEGSSQGEGGGEGEGSTAPDLSFVPETFVKDGAHDGQAFRTAYDELASFKAQAEEAKQGLPEKADDYKFEIPADFEVPEGLEVTIDGDDPDVQTLKALAHEHGMSQEAMNGLAGLLAGRELRAQEAAAAEAQAEMEILGPTAQSRIDTIKHTLDARLPAEMAEALAQGAFSANAVKGLEKLLSGPGARQTTPASTPDTSNMTPYQKLELANQMQAGSGRRRRAG